MARTTPQVEQGMVTLGPPGATHTFHVGTSEWFDWLATVTAFTFISTHGTFTARRERASSGRGGWYWRAYQRRAGKLQRAYLGTAADLTLERLQSVAINLAHVLPPGSASDHMKRHAAVPELLTTKLSLPPVRTTFVARARLYRKLWSGLHGKLTLIAAPAGFGKTTLLSDWLRHLGAPNVDDQAGNDVTSSHVPIQAPAVAWLSLDAADNDPATFLRYLIAALQTVVPDIGVKALALLGSPHLPSLEIPLTTLLNDAATLPRETLLVVDDYHVISTLTIHEALAFLLDHLPPVLHLIIATREDPPLPLARLRARGQLTEVRAAELRFTFDEVNSFLLETMQLPLSLNMIAALDSRTEGWVAGLQLAALAMDGRSDVEGFVAAFSGSNRYVVDYLIEEVFASQPPHIQDFLLRTAILDRLCGSLCDALLDVEAHDVVNDDYSQLILDELERRNLFLVPLDDSRHWYRYHHLFAEVLRERLRHGASAVEVAILHRRACIWFEQHDNVVEAVQHALTAPDFERAADLIERGSLGIASRGQSYTVRGWLHALPESLIRDRAMLCFIDAVLRMNANQFEEAAERLTDAEHCLDTAESDAQRRTIYGQILLARANLARLASDMEAAVAFAEQALLLVPETLPWLRVVAELIAARAYQVSGDVSSTAERRWRGAVMAARDIGNLSAYRTGLALLGQMHMLQGRRHLAGAIYAEAMHLLIGREDMEYLGGAAACCCGYGEWLREHNELDDAEQYLVKGMDLSHGPETVEAETLLFGTIALARLRQARGDSLGGLAILLTFDDVASRRPVAPRLLARFAAARAWFHLQQGDLAFAASWADDVAQGTKDWSLFPHEFEAIILARIRIVQRRYDDALEIVNRLLKTAEGNDRIGSTIEILVVQALAYAAQHNQIAALTVLARALTLAAPEGYVRIFVDEGPPMAKLLREALHHRIVPDYVVHLLAVFADTETVERALVKEVFAVRHTSRVAQLLTEPLTPRELEVLRLVADGASNSVIADALVISVGTAKKHVNNILAKIDARSRTQAAIWARDHGVFVDHVDT